MTSSPATPSPLETPVVRSRPSLVVTAAAGLVAGACAWLAVSRLIDFEYLPPEIMGLLGRPTPQQQATFDAAVRIRDYRNAAIAYATLGAAAGGLIGGAACLRRSKTAVVGMIAGLAFGAICGAHGGAAGQFLVERLRTTPLDSILRTTAATATAFVMTGFGVGAAVAVTSRRAAPLVGAIAAALIAGLVYPVLVAALFPAVPTDKVVPWQAWPQLLWAMLPSALFGIAVGRTVRRGPHDSAPPPDGPGA